MAESDLAEEFLPVYDVSDAVATVADVDAGTAWRALLDVDLLTVGREGAMVGVLGALRAASCSANARATSSRWDLWASSGDR